MMKNNWKNYQKFSKGNFLSRKFHILSPSGHIQKGIEIRSALSKLIDSGKLGQNDENIARQLRRNLQSAEIDKFFDFTNQMVEAQIEKYKIFLL